MEEIVFEHCTKKDIKFIDDRLVEYNQLKMPTDQKPLIIDWNFCIKNDEGKVLAGIVSCMYWYDLFIELLWVDKSLQGRGLGSKLLNHVITLAKEKGCGVVHLDTFDAQAPDFYKKHGFEIFGVLDNPESGHKRYFMKKELG
jgi:GNAT superfamily N-acetyltransferase